jgi:hypothetical protein
MKSRGLDRVHLAKSKHKRLDIARVERTLPSASSELALSLLKGQALSAAFDLAVALN